MATLRRGRCCCGQISGRDNTCLNDHGELTLQLSVLFPAIVLFVFLSVQVGLWWHGSQVAHAAAAEAVEAAQTIGATNNDGAQAAVWFLSQAGLLQNVTVQVTRTPLIVTATVTAEAFQIIPLGSWSITETSVGVLEQTVSQTNR